MKNDALQIYRGKDFIINEKIIIHQPTLDEICDWGEEKYFSFIYNFTATPTDKKYQLHLAGIDWNEISDYELFLSSYKMFTKDYSSIVFGDLDFEAFEIYQDKTNDEMVLYDPTLDIKFDRSIYEIATDYLRKAHNLKKNVERAMTDTTRDVLIEEAKENIEMNKDKPYHSQLLSLISTMTNMEGFKYGWVDVWNMKINAFIDAVNSIQHIKNADLLLSSGYSGFGIDLKKINKKELSYFRPDES